jgi:undecaprenyl-diphosphatase
LNQSIKFNLFKIIFLTIFAFAFIISINNLEGFLLKFFSIKGNAWLNPFDEKVFLWINNNNLNIAFLMLTITYMGSTISWLGIAILLWFLKKRKEAFILVFALLIGGVSTFFMKIAFHRVRPFQILIEAKVLDKEENFSFPSGHSVSSFSSAIILERKIKKQSFFIYALASLIAYSRIYIGAHWPSDVIVGTAIGLTIGFLNLKFENKILNFFIKSKEVERKST